MNRIYVFTNKDSNNDRIFTGKSSSKNTLDGGVIKLDVKNRDQLISNAILLAPDNSYILIAFGPLSTNMSTKEIYNAIEFIIKKIPFDVMYLTNYSDNCSLRSDDHTFNFMMFQRSVSPHGTECILISPSGVNRILELIKGEDGRGYDFYLNNAAEKMLLYVSSPPMLMVDESQRSSEMQLIKSTVCKEMISAQRPLELTKKYSGNMNLFWFFLIVIFILFIAAMLISFGGQIKTVPETTLQDVIRDPVLPGKENIAKSMSPWI